MDSGSPNIEGVDLVSDAHRTANRRNHAAIELTGGTEGEDGLPVVLPFPGPTIGTRDQLDVHGLVDGVVAGEEAAEALLHVEHGEPVELQIRRILVVGLKDQDWADPFAVDTLGRPQRDTAMDLLQVVSLDG